MTLVAGISDNDKKKISKSQKIDEIDGAPVSTENSLQEKLTVELKEALNDAFDIIEGKKPRKTLRDIFNG